MTSQVVVNIDAELKKIAMAKAKKDGITMKALLGYFLKWYVEDEITIGAKFRRGSYVNKELVELWFIREDKLSTKNIKLLEKSKKSKNRINI